MLTCFVSVMSNSDACDRADADLIDVKDVLLETRTTSVSTRLNDHLEFFYSTR